MRNKKLEILASTIEQDQKAVANQWTDTFYHNSPDDVATQMTQLLAACVAVGDFKTRAKLSKSPDLQAPSDQLTIIDYLSHASRIALDYQNLSGPNKAELLKYFPAAGTAGVVSRSATHDVNRKAGKVVEGKDILLGLLGQLPEAVKEARDFGVNIAMGGEGRTNYYRNTISANGYSGHFYFHRNDADNLLLLGLEQSAPSTATQLATQLIFGAPAASHIQQGHDQFDQGHSLVGASDTFTAAGSLYFSDPVYQAKLILEKGCVPPDKYDGMQVTITDENWPKIKQFIERLKQSVEARSRDEIFNQLMQKPATAKPVKDDVKSYIALEFGSYLKQILSFITDSNLKATVQAKQLALLTTINQLQSGDASKYQTFLDQIEDLLQVNIPEYQQAINRIKYLFAEQLKIDSKFKQTHEEIVLERQYDELKIESCQLLEQLSEVKKYYQAAHIGDDANISSFIMDLDLHITKLLDPHSPTAKKKDDLFASWIAMDVKPSQKSINELTRCIDEARKFVLKAPKLYSELVVKELKDDLKEEIAQTLRLADASVKQLSKIESMSEQMENLSKEIVKVTEIKNHANKENQKLFAELKQHRQLLADKEKQKEPTIAPSAKIAPLVKDSSSHGFPTMQVIGGFIAVLGVAAIAVAFTVLAAATFGVGMLAGAGVVATLAGLGMFAKGTIDRCSKEPENGMKIVA